MDHFDKGFTLIWKIENFSMLPHQPSEKLESPAFVVDNLDKTKWCLCLYPKGCIENSKHLALFLYRTDCDTNDTTISKVSFTLALESVNSIFETSISFGNAKISSDCKSKGCNKFHELKIVHDNINLYAPHDILTIGCHIWSSKGATEIILRESTILTKYFENRHFARTTIDVQRRVLTWPITKVSKLNKSQGKISIDLENCSENYPALKLSFCIDKTLNDKHARIEILQTRSFSKECVFAKCKITVVGVRQTSREDSHLFSSDLNEIWHFPDLISIENIDEYAYVDDTMFLQCEFAFSRKGNERHVAIPPMHVPFKERSEPTELRRSLRGFLDSRSLCDVELRTSVQSYPCHKLVLCAQSPVFSTMFENDTREKETGVVEITDVNHKTLEELLKFLYSEKIESGLPVEDICELYSAADKYGVSLLRRRCSLLLLSKLSVENACRILVAADGHRDGFLSKHVDTFLSVHAREVFHSPEWKTFMADNPTLSKDTMIKICMQEPYV